MGGKTPDVAVIGAGLVGLGSALALQRAGLSTLLLDGASDTRAASFGPASTGNAGHIALEQVRPLANPTAVRSAARRLFALGGPLDFRLRDVTAWGGWAARYLASSGPGSARAGEAALGLLLGSALPAWRRLARDVGRPDLLIESGHLVVWEGVASAERGRASWAATPTGEARLRDLTPSERSALSASLTAAPADGVAFDGTAQVASPSALLGAVSAAFLAAGGQRREGFVHALRREDGRAVVELADGTLRAGLVVVAGGVGSGALMRGLGHAAPVVAERGYHIEAETHGWTGLPPVVFEDRAVVATRFGARLRATSFVEFARPDAPPDPRKWARLERHAAELGLPMRGEVSRWIGSRPTLPDYLPAIGRSARAGNLIYAFGHQHLGLTLGPLTGELVADLALGRSPALTLDAFDLNRFAATKRRRA